jgi:hypothetical protein
MPLLKYFLSIGTLLSLLLYGWSEYLEPPVTKTQAGPAAKAGEVFRPTPAPPIVKTEQPPSVETSSSAAIEVQNLAITTQIQRAKPKKQRVRVARRRATPQDSFAYAPPRPWFFDWR